MVGAVGPSTPLVFREARSTEVERVREALRRCYYPEEPITASYVHGKEPTADDERFSLSFVGQGTVVLAVEQPDERIVGVAVAGPIKPGDPDAMLREAATTETRKWADILRLLALLERRADVCGRYGVPLAYQVHILGVDPVARGRALGQKLLEYQMALAKRLGYEVFSADFTSAFSVRIGARIGMECISELSLSEYQDETGEQLFTAGGPHQVIKTYAKVL